MTAPEIRKQAVTAGKIAPKAVDRRQARPERGAAGQPRRRDHRPDKIAAGAVQAEKIKNNVITTNKLTNASVTSQKLANGAVGTSNLGGSAVTGGEARHRLGDRRRTGAGSA